QPSRQPPNPADDGRRARYPRPTPEPQGLKRALRGQNPVTRPWFSLPTRAPDTLRKGPARRATGTKIDTGPTAPLHGPRWSKSQARGPWPSEAPSDEKTRDTRDRAHWLRATSRSAPAPFPGYCPLARR